MIGIITLLLGLFSQNSVKEICRKKINSRTFSIKKFKTLNISKKRVHIGIIMSKT